MNLLEIWDSKIFRQQAEEARRPTKKPVRIVPATDYDPYSGEWSAIDINRYDGAEDAGHQYIGYGKTEKEAIDDLRQQIEDDDQ